MASNLKHNATVNEKKIMSTDLGIKRANSHARLKKTFLSFPLGTSLQCKSRNQFVS